jgi:toxin ParE1/3/4
MTRLEILPRARMDILEQARYLGRQSPGAPTRFFKALDATFTRLARSPRVGARWDRPVAGAEELRVWPVSRFRTFLVFYRPTQDGIQIVRVLHGARDLDAILGSDAD